MKFKRRIGPDPHEDGKGTHGANGCPDIWELEDGSYAIIGARMTAALIKSLPESAGCGPDEEIVVIPRDTLLLAKRDIPND